MNILLAITFVFGPLKCLTHTKAFGTNIGHPLSALFGANNKKGTVLGGAAVLFDVWSFYFSLAFQAWFWLFK